MATAFTLCRFGSEARAQAAAGLISQFLNQTRAAADSKLGAIATGLTGKIQSLAASLGTNSVAKSELDNTLQSLTGGKDNAALSSAFKLVSDAKLTPEQMGLAKQVGQLASAYVVEKNFASLQGAQGNVATIVNSLRKGEITPAIPALKKVATNAHLTEGQKTLISTVADQYAPGWKQAGKIMSGFKKLGF